MNRKEWGRVMRNIWRKKEGKVTGKILLQRDIDYVIHKSNSLNEAMQRLTDMGYQIREGISKKYGKYVTYYSPLGGKGRRDYNLGKGYRLYEMERILEKRMNDFIKTILPYKNTVYRKGDILHYQGIRLEAFANCFRD